MPVWTRLPLPIGQVVAGVRLRRAVKRCPVDLRTACRVSLLDDGTASQRVLTSAVESTIVAANPELSRPWHATRFGSTGSRGRSGFFRARRDIPRFTLGACAAAATSIYTR